MSSVITGILGWQGQEQNLGKGQTHHPSIQPRPGNQPRGSQRCSRASGTFRRPFCLGATLYPTAESSGLLRQSPVIVQERTFSLPAALRRTPRKSSDWSGLAPGPPLSSVLWPEAWANVIGLTGMLPTPTVRTGRRLMGWFY